MYEAGYAANGRRRDATDMMWTVWQMQQASVTGAPSRSPYFEVDDRPSAEVVLLPLEIGQPLTAASFEPVQLETVA